MDEGPRDENLVTPNFTRPIDVIRPAQPAQQPVQPAQPVQPVQPAQPAQPVAPVEQRPETAKSEDITTSGKMPKKSKKPFIIIGALLVTAAVVCGVVAILMATVFKSDNTGVEAITKILNGEVSKNIEAKGKLDITLSGESTTSGVKSLSLDFDAKSAISYSTHTIDGSLAIDTEDGDYTLSLNTIFASDGDVYIKIGDVDGLESLDAASRQVATAITDRWILFDFDASVSPLDGFGLFGGDSTTQCVVSKIAGLSNYGNSLSSIYKQNSFITFSTNDIKIAKKSNPIYKLGIDENKFADFINALTNTTFVKDLMACSGDTVDSSRKITASDVKEIFDSYPTVYAEIDEDYNFTRLYVNATMEDGSTLVADIDLSYPSRIDVVEPTEYIDFVQILETILNQMFASFQQS